MTRKRNIRLVTTVAVFAIVAFGDWQSARERWARRSIERVEFVTATARGQHPEPPTAAATPSEDSVAATSNGTIPTSTCASSIATPCRR